MEKTVVSQCQKCRLKDAHSLCTLLDRYVDEVPDKEVHKNCPIKKSDMLFTFEAIVIDKTNKDYQDQVRLIDIFFKNPRFTKTFGISVYDENGEEKGYEKGKTALFDDDFICIIDNEDNGTWSEYHMLEFNVEYIKNEYSEESKTPFELWRGEEENYPKYELLIDIIQEILKD